MAGPVREAVHQDPVWRERSNFVLAATIAGNSEISTEQLWGRQIDAFRFEICCIPFFVSDLALGDIVETDDSYLVSRVVQPSGRYVFRIWFGESFQPRDEVVNELTALGALTEWSSPNLLGVDATDRKHAQVIADFLDARERAGQLLYETGRS